jgi:hypothetical protein
MPDERPQSSMVQIVSLVINCIQTIVIAWLSVQANANHEKIEKVQETQQEVKVTQQEAADTSKQVKTALDDKNVKDDATRARLLYGQWKWLDDNAVSAQDKEEAAKAKKLYEEFAKKKN